jgi:hypothetical protein
VAGGEKERLPTGGWSPVGKRAEVESASGSREVRPEVPEHGLKEDAIGFRDALIIGIASTAPAYSLPAYLRETHRAS